MPVQRSQPGYRQVADQLRAAIEAGEWGRGEMLPSEPELAARFGVSRATVNNAVAILRTWGIVRVRRGRGTVVQELPVIRRNATARYSTEARERAGAHGAFDTEIRSLGLEPRGDTTVDQIPATAEVAAALRIAEGEPVIRRQRKMYANEIPVQLAPSYIPASIAAGTPIAEVNSGPGGIISRFAELGYRQTRITESVRVRPATPEEQDFLSLDENQQVIEIQHIGWTAEGRPVELAVHSVPAGLWTLDYEWAIE